MGRPRLRIFRHYSSTSLSRLPFKKGHGFPSVRLWVLVEKRLTDVLADIWTGVLKKPESPPDEIVETQLKAPAQRLQLTLEL